MAAEQASVESLVGLLQRCRQERNLHQAGALLAYMRQHHLDKHRVLGNYLVPLLVECGYLADARLVFDQLPYRSEHAWSSLLLGYINSGHPQHAFGLYLKMQQDSVPANSHICVALLKACARLQDAEAGQRLHAEIIKQGSLAHDPFVGNILVDMYCKCGLLVDAHRMFDMLPVRDAVSYNTLIAGYADFGLEEEVFSCFEQMQLEGIPGVGVTYLCSLKACGSTGAPERGQLLYSGMIMKSMEKDIFVCSALVSMYAKCGMLEEAQKVFNELPIHNIVSWNALITGYANSGLAREVLSCIEQIHKDSISPDNVTFTCGLKACSSLGATINGQEIHAEVVKRGLEGERSINTSLVDMYAKCNLVAESRSVFDSCSDPDAVSWSALISVYAESGLGDEAVNFLEQMQLNGVSLMVDTLISGLKACSIIGAMENGHGMHTEVVKRGFERDVFAGSSLLDMYAKCGLLAEAQEVFDKLPVRDVTLWNTLIKGYGENHKAPMAVQCFEDMLDQGVKPDAITFTCLLAACSYASLVFKGQQYFTAMIEQYELEPTLDHCSTMVDLLARSGRVYEAERFAEAMQCFSCKEILRTLLSACRTYCKFELGLKCFQQLVLVNGEDATSYLLMADIYACEGRWLDAGKIEEMRKYAKVKKRAASASIEVNKKWHEFTVNVNQGKGLSLVLDFLSSFSKVCGHVPNADLV